MLYSKLYYLILWYIKKALNLLSAFLIVVFENSENEATSPSFS